MYGSTVFRFDVFYVLALRSTRADTFNVHLGNAALVNFTIILMNFAVSCLGITKQHQGKKLNADQLWPDSVTELVSGILRNAHSFL